MGMEIKVRIKIKIKGEIKAARHTPPPQKGPESSPPTFSTKRVESSVGFLLL
jgi:hypothetical protein